MKDSEVQKFSCSHLSGQFPCCSSYTLSEKDTISNDAKCNDIAYNEKQDSSISSSDFTSDSITTAVEDVEQDVSSYSTTKLDNNNIVTELSFSTAQETCLTDFKSNLSDENSFSSLTPLYSNSFTNDLCIKSNINSLYKNNLHIKSKQQDYFIKRIKNPKYAYGNPLSDFVCSKCGLGLPCTVFLCRRINLSDNTHSKKSISQTNDNSLNNIKYANPFFEYKVSNIEYSSEDTLPLECQKTYNSTCIDNLKEKKHFSSSEKDSLKKNKMQNKNESNTLNIDIKLSKDLKNVSIISDTTAFNSQHVLQTSKEVYNSLQSDSTDVIAVANDFSEAQSSKMPVESLSQGTRNFLNELASNAASTFSENVSGFALSSINPPFSFSKSKKMSETGSNDNQKEDSAPHDESNTLCDISSDNKEVTNALDLIEQSSLHDRDLSSAEICNSLNQIFSEANSDLSASIDSSVENNQTEETSAEYETITVSMSNESEILFQAADSDISFSANTETGTINLADLCAGNDPEILQRILLVHDESGNIETVYLLPDDAQITEEVSPDELSNVEIIPLSKNDIKGTDQDQCIVSNVLIDESTQVQDVLITQGVENLENVLTTEVFTGEDENKLAGKSDASPSETFLENNPNLNDGLLNIENSVDQSSKSVQYSEHSKEVELEEMQIKNNINMEPIKTNENNLDKGEILVSDQSLDSLKIVQKSPIQCEKISVVNDNISELENNTKLNQNNKAVPFNLSRNSEIPEPAPSTTIPISSKAKKSCFRGISNGKSDLIHFNQSPLNSDVTSTLTPVNGAIYCSESSDILPDRTKHHLSNLSNPEQLNNGQLLFNKSLQKSKKTLRSAKKSFSGSQINNSSLNVSENSLSESYNLLTHSKTMFNDIIQKGDDYKEVRELLLKRGIVDEDIIQKIHKRLKTVHFDNKYNNEIEDYFNGLHKAKTRSVALKTFKKPFTAAKKSFDSRETLRSLKNIPLRTSVPKSDKIKIALKSFTHKQFIAEPKKMISTGNFLSRTMKENNANIAQSHQNKESKAYIQPEICEIRILPNDYVKRASQLLFKDSTETASTPEENVSDDEIKLSSTCSSPLKELMLLKFQCTCTAKEMPCLCYDGNLQLICEAEDSFDENVVSCKNHVSQQYLLTPSSEIKHRAFCDTHLWRLRQHHCCPKCGIFCSQGEFLLCSNDELEVKENHLFHTSCFIVPSPGLPPGCPHCCKFSNFNSVCLIHKSASDQGQKEVPFNAQNITSELDSCDIFLTVKQGVSSEDKAVSKVFVPEKSEIQLMITSLAKEKTLRLRPTGKCLYNPIKTGDVQKVMQLLGNGVNPNHKFRMHGNNAPLHVAAHYGWTGILHILLQAGAFIDSVNDDLETPLIVAVEKNQLPIVRYLVLAGAQIDVKDCNGMTSFHIASKNGFKEIAEFLYNTGRLDINLQDDGGWTALVWACEHKHVDFVKWLLKIGSDPNVRDNEENTVLHWAAYSGKSEIAELLLERGCTLSYVNKRGDSALHIAAREDNYECVKLFIERGAVVDQKNKDNKTPLMCCEDDSLSFNYLSKAISSGTLKIGKKQLEKHVVFRDISRGAEAYPIQAINEVDDEEFIMEFRYVIKQCHRSGVNINSIVDSMQFCYCKDNCVTRDCNCTMNSKCWYDANGCLTSEYDIQSLPPIFECNKTCHCPKTCINRVVQHGLRFPLQIFRTRFQGWGVRSLQDIPKGAFVCEYVGELITGSEATERDDDTYFFDLESQQADYCLDGRYYGNVARFLNHSCEPNLIALKVFVDHQDLNFPRIAFFALKEIQAFEELCFDYGLDFWLVKCQTLLCTCKTPLCKYSKDTIDDTLSKFFMDTKNGAQMDSGS